MLPLLNLGCGVAVGYASALLFRKKQPSAGRSEEEALKARQTEALAAALACSEEAHKNFPFATVRVPCAHNREFPCDPATTALVLIDMQTDFLEKDGRLGQFYPPEKLASVRRAIPGVQRLLAAARKAGMTVAHSRSHRYGADIRTDLVGVNDAGYELLPECGAREGEIVVDKWTFGAFASTELEQRLRERGVKCILLAGILTNVCILATAVQAVDRLFRVALVEDATAAFSPEWHRMGVALLNEPQTQPGHAQKATGLYFGTYTYVIRKRKEFSAMAKTTNSTHTHTHTHTR